MIFDVIIDSDYGREAHLQQFELRYRGVVPTAQMRGSMSRRTAIGSLPLLTACNRPDTGGTLTEHRLVDDASVGFDLQPAATGLPLSLIIPIDH